MSQEILILIIYLLKPRPILFQDPNFNLKKNKNKKINQFSQVPAKQAYGQIFILLKTKEKRKEKDQTYKTSGFKLELI